MQCLACGLHSVRCGAVSTSAPSVRLVVRRNVRARAERATSRRDSFRRSDTLRPPRRRSSVEPDDDDEYEEGEWEEEQGRGGGGGGGGGPPPPPGWLDAFNSRGGSVTAALVAGAFAVGIGAGVAFDTVVTLDRDNVASNVMFDRSLPNADACAAFGASAVVFDQRIFLSFNPFNVYVTQPEVKPGCVLRRSNWGVLESRQLVDDTEVNDCKRHMNTFAFVGDLEKAPEVSCVYHSETAENQFLKDPASSILGDGVRPRADVRNPGTKTFD